MLRHMITVCFLLRIFESALCNMKCDLKFYHGNHDPVQDFH